MKQMKFLSIALCTILMGAMLSSCEQYPNYRYAIQKMLPDSIKAKEMTFITETMKATDFHLTTSDYEDPEDVVEKLKWTFESAYEVPVEGLEIQTCSQCVFDFIPYEKLNDKQKIIFESLRNGNKN